MAVFKELGAQDIQTVRSSLYQVVDIIQEDVSGSSTRKKYQVFVTGGVGPGVTSSLFQTVYDQDFTLSTANPVMDMSVGLYFSGSTVQDIKSGEDSAGKLLFPSTSLMMREKVNVYKQFALALLGDADGRFAAPFGSEASGSQIDEALFLSYRRLFARDGVRRETFALKFYESASHGADTAGYNLNQTSENGARIYTDTGAAANQEVTFGGRVSNIVDSSDTDRNVGVLFNDQGIAVLDLGTVISGAQHVSGVVDAMSSAALDGTHSPGETVVGHPHAGNPNAKFIPDFLTSGSIDDIIDHFATARFSSGTLSANVFQNETILNSSLVYCRADAEEFNYSSNPTYVDANNRINVIDEGQEGVQTPFIMFTTVGLYDANNNLMAVGKMSRPVEKSPEKQITTRLRIDF